MAKLYNLEAIALGNELSALAFSKYPNLKLPTFGETAMEFNSKETRVVGVRFPVELLDWIDNYSRILAVDRKKRVTRNMVVIGFLEQMKSVIEYREQHEFDGTHVEEIEKVIDLARSQQSERVPS